MLTPLRVVAASVLDVGRAVIVPGRSRKSRKSRLKRSLIRFYVRCERAGLIARMPTFDERYSDYPELRAFEAAHAEIRAECEALLRVRDRITDISVLGGRYTKEGIHTIGWKAFMFKSGRMIGPNCELAPKTAAIVRATPGVYNAFFSILEPRQYVRPHWGYFKGFVRYHLGVIVPGDDEKRKCWLRVNDDPDDNLRREKRLVERGEKYYWREGRGVVFDDTNLHDAANESDEVRVVLWVDAIRKLPPPLSAVTRGMLAAIYHLPSIRRIRENAVVAPPATTAPHCEIELAVGGPQGPN
jgi:beta-hydroxylase